MVSSGIGVSSVSAEAPSDPNAGVKDSMMVVVAASSANSLVIDFMVLILVLVSSFCFSFLCVLCVIFKILKKREYGETLSFTTEKELVGG